MPQNCASIRIASAHPACLFRVLSFSDIANPAVHWDSVPVHGVVGDSFPTQRRRK